MRRKEDQQGVLSPPQRREQRHVAARVEEGRLGGRWLWLEPVLEAPARLQTGLAVSCFPRIGPQASCRPLSCLSFPTHKPSW